MSSDYSNPDGESTGRRSPGILLLILGVLFGVAMAVLGFLAGRATATVPTPTEVAGPVEISTEVTASAVTPETATAAPAENETIEPTIPPSPTPEPTDEPTVEPPTPTAAPVADFQAPGESPIGEADLATFHEVWGLITDGYDGDMPPSVEVIQSAISGSLESLGDDYTRYIPPAIAERMREDMDGAVEGIGAIVRENEEGLYEIVRPIDGQPADLAGLLPGDVLIEVDGQSVLEISFEEVILMVRGPQGTTVTLKVLRDGEPEPLEFTITRVRYEEPIVEYEILSDEMTGGTPIGYIRLTEFNRIAEEKLLEAIDAILAKQPTGLVFDLRDNPGGFLDQSVAVADAFLSDGVALFERNNRGLNETFTTDSGDAAEAIPMVVLVNAGSASAAEIVAGAIQDRGRGVLIGETTFGKGSVQQIIPLTDGGELRVTVARWYTPNNHTIDGEGITPDIEVETPPDLGGVDDGQLQRAVDYLINGQ